MLGMDLRKGGTKRHSPVPRQRPKGSPRCHKAPNYATETGEEDNEYETESSACTAGRLAVDDGKGEADGGILGCGEIVDGIEYCN